MLDSRTGDLTFLTSGLRLGPTLTREEFFRMQVARSAEPQVINESWATYRMEFLAGEIAPFPAAVHLYFYNNALARLSLMDVSAEFDVDPSNLSREAELARAAEEEARRAAHDGWLALQGAPPGSYPWGRVWSDYDDKSGCSSIVLRYDDAGEH